MIRLVICALEDVIELDENNIVKEEVLDQVLALKEKGIQFGIATGKNYNAVKDLFGRVKDDILYICNDGGVVIYQDKVISEATIDRLVCLGILDDLEDKNDIDAVLFGQKDAVMLHHNFWLSDMVNSAGIKAEFSDNPDQMRGNTTKIALFARNGWDEHSYNELFTKWASKANVSATDVHQAFITAAGVNKGAAIGAVQELYDISKEDTVVFGANFSDIDMFDYSYFGYAMMHSNPQVKNSAQHIAENIEIIIEDILRI